jgi:hypothetical protein
MERRQCRLIRDQMLVNTKNKNMNNGTATMEKIKRTKNTLHY